MTTITTKNIMFFMFILKSLIIQYFSKNFFYIQSFYFSDKNKIINYQKKKIFSPKKKNKLEKKLKIPFGIRFFNKNIPKKYPYKTNKLYSRPFKYHLSPQHRKSHIPSYSSKSYYLSRNLDFNPSKSKSHKSNSTHPSKDHHYKLIHKLHFTDSSKSKFRKSYLTYSSKKYHNNKRIRKSYSTYPYKYHHKKYHHKLNRKSHSIYPLKSHLYRNSNPTSPSKSHLSRSFLHPPYPSKSHKIRKSNVHPSQSNSSHHHQLHTYHLKYHRYYNSYFNNLKNSINRNLDFNNFKNYELKLTRLSFLSKKNYLFRNKNFDNHSKFDPTQTQKKSFKINQNKIKNSIWIKIYSFIKNYKKPSLKEKRVEWWNTKIQENKKKDKEEINIKLNKMNEKSRMNIYYNNVHLNVKNYFNAKKYVKILIKLSNYYFPMFEEKLEKHDLPKDLKYIAVLESSLDPIIISRSGAKGIWQFMRITGKLYKLYSGLKNKYDDRNDPVKSTDAACLYLTYIYKNVKNWKMVLASYNSGINKILKYYFNKKNFWKEFYSLPKKTQNYIHKFMLINYILNYYKKYNKYFYFLQSKYRIRNTVLLSTHEEESSQNLNEKKSVNNLTKLNPNFEIKNVTIDNKKVLIRIPRNKLSTFKD